MQFENAHLTRSVLWFGPIDYCYGSGSNATKLVRRPLESNDDIYAMSQKLSKYLKANFNSCLVNLYENESQTVPKHSDDEPIFGTDPVIASLSFGASRRFIIEPKPIRLRSTVQHLQAIRSQYVFCLEDGDLLVMRGPMQRYWNHSVPKEISPCGPRINLTFRNVV